MSQNVIFELSNATARSKGQAIRHQHPNLSSDAREAHRKAARQKRTELKKGKAERKNRKEQSQEPPLAPLTRMERPSDIMVNGSIENRDSHHDHDTNSRIGCSAFTMFPRSQSMTNKRALGQANRYISANARKQSEQDTGGTLGMKSGKSSAVDPDFDLNHLMTEPVDEDGSIAESAALMLMNIAKGAAPLVPCEQPTEIYLPEFEEKDWEQLSTINPIEPIRKATSIHGNYCVEPLCEYFTKGFASKQRRDCHVLSHYNRTTICEFCSVTVPLGVRSFASVDALKNHIMFMHFCERDRAISACMTCNGICLDPEWFFYHIEGCVLRWMEKRATEGPLKCSSDYGMESLQVSWR